MKSKRVKLVAFAVFLLILITSFGITPVREKVNSSTELLKYSIKEKVKGRAELFKYTFPHCPFVISPVTNNAPIANNNDAVLFIHDISPIYFNYLKEIDKTVRANHFEKFTYLFLITYHHGKYNLANYPKFVNYLKQMEKAGYHMEYHAYKHNGAEFCCTGKEAEYKLDASLAILKKCGFRNVNLFFPPHGIITKSAINVFLNHHIAVITKRILFVPTPKGLKAYPTDNQEYTWYIKEKQLPGKLKRAKLNYSMALKNGELFCLSVHPGAVNTTAGMKFLKEMLQFINNKKNNP